MLWLNFGRHRLEKCCCGYGLVDIGWRHVAVAKVWLTSAGVMLVWLRFDGHRLVKCCCGKGLADIGWRNFAVAKVLWASAGEIVLVKIWLTLACNIICRTKNYAITMSVLKSFIDPTNCRQICLV